MGIEPRRDSKLLFNSSPDVQRTGIPTIFLLFQLSATKKGAPKYRINLWRKVAQRESHGEMSRGRCRVCPEPWNPQVLRDHPGAHCGMLSLLLSLTEPWGCLCLLENGLWEHLKDQGSRGRGRGSEVMDTKSKCKVGHQLYMLTQTAVFKM